MLRTHTTRHAGGALALVLATVLSLVLGSLGTSAGAEDGTPPGATVTDGSTPTSEAEPSDPATEPTEPTEPMPGGTTLGRELAAGPLLAQPDFVVWKRGISGNVGVNGNDTCPSTCTWSLMSKPSGWAVSMTTAGMVTMKVPATTRPGSYRIYYRLSHAETPDPSVSSLLVAVTPDNYGAPSGMAFTHPYRKGHRYKIRDRILRTINSVPPRGTIQVASWSFSSKTYRVALKKAMRRGVTVQIVLAQRNKADNSDYRLLKRTFGTTVTPTGSWVKKCARSCRGVSGTMHSKIFLFSASFRTPYVMMTGSANLTDFAVTNQWNQMNVVSNNKPVYLQGVQIFNQMVLDRPASPMYVEAAFPTLTNIYYPATTLRTSTDFMYKALNKVQCRGATNTKNGRTVIKIAMYAWYETRGKWLAKQVRKLWGEGCQIQIVYGISSNPVKKILFSPSGRGRIPMRQILLTNTDEVPIYYIHDKWVAIKGHYGASRGTSISFQGSFNFSDLGFKSDENFQVLPGSGYYRSFARDFTLLWKDRQARAPSPISTIPVIEGRASEDDLRLGTGTYRYMEAD